MYICLIHTKTLFVNAFANGVQTNILVINTLKISCGKFSFSKGV